MPQNEFRVRKSSNGYCVELFRNGRLHVTFLDGLTYEAAKREAHALTVLWRKISVRPTSSLGLGRSIPSFSPAAKNRLK